MENLKTWSQLFWSSLQGVLDKFIAILPDILGAIAILFIGWLFAKIVSGIFGRIFKAIKLDGIGERFNVTSALEKANIKKTPSQVLSKFIYWLILLLVLTTVLETLGWTAVSEKISDLFGYLPKLFIGILFFFVGSYMASFIRDIIKGASESLGLSAGNLFGNIVYYFLMVVVALTALKQAEFNTSLLESNLVLIIGSILLAGSISYGIASRDVLQNILASFFSRKTFKEGQVIEIDGIRGQIIQVSNMSVIIVGDNEEKTVIPANELITKKVKILG